MYEELLMAKPRPTEIKLVANLLDPDNTDSESAADLAVEIIEALDLSRGKRDNYIVVAQLARWAPVQAWGEFSTKLQADKFTKNLSAVDSDGGRAGIVHLEQPEKLLERIGELKK
jgi:hypothetical protein